MSEPVRINIPLSKAAKAKLGAQHAVVNIPQAQVQPQSKHPRIVIPFDNDRDDQESDGDVIEFERVRKPVAGKAPNKYVQRRIDRESGVVPKKAIKVEINWHRVMTLPITLFVWKHAFGIVATILVNVARVQLGLPRWVILAYLPIPIAMRIALAIFIKREKVNAERIEVKPSKKAKAA